MSGKFSNVERGSSREIPYIQASSDRPVDQQEDSIGNKEEVGSVNIVTSFHFNSCAKLIKIFE